MTDHLFADGSRDAGDGLARASRSLSNDDQASAPTTVAALISFSPRSCLHRSLGVRYCTISIPTAFVYRNARTIERRSERVAYLMMSLTMIPKLSILGHDLTFFFSKF